MIAESPANESADVETPVIRNITRPWGVFRVAPLKPWTAIEEEGNGTRGIDGGFYLVISGKFSDNPQPKPLLVILEEIGGEHLLRIEPRVAADGKEVTKRGMMQREICVGGRRISKETDDAILGFDRALVVCLRGEALEVSLLACAELNAQVLRVRTGFRGWGVVFRSGRGA